MSLGHDYHTGPHDDSAFDAVMDYLLIGAGVVMIGLGAVILSPIWVPLVVIGWLTTRLWAWRHPERRSE